MSTTQIKRLFQSSKEFVPITLAEAVVVNTANLPGLQSLGITTLDKVLRTTLGVVGTNAADIQVLNQAVTNINTELAKKQNKLTAGAGINITPDGVISATLNIELYKIVTVLPTPPSTSYVNSIYLVPSAGGVSGNIFKEFICVYEPTQKQYIWEEIGTIQTDVDLSGYVTLEVFNREINTIKGQLASTITATDVTTSTGSKVVVNYIIPEKLYDSMVNTDLNDQIIGG